MGKIYVGQSALTLTLDTEIDLSTAAAPRIYYTKPSGSSGYWEAAVVETTKLSYEVADTEQLDEEGMWVFWAYCTFAGKPLPGEAEEKYVYSQGQ